MRVIQIVCLVVVGISIEATAGPRPGGGSGTGRGRLGQVSVGIAGATSTGGSARSSGTTNARSWSVACADEQYRRRVYDGVCVRRCREGDLYRASDGACVRRTVAIVDGPHAVLETDAVSTPSGAQRTAQVSAYFGGQKVFESDGAIALDAAISDRWFRVGVGLTRFYERQPDRDALTLTIPSLAFGVRLDDSDTTRVYLEGGVVGAMTRNDSMMDSSINGVLGGVYAEHSLSKHTTLIGAARLLGFEADVRAASIRAGVRYRHLQASFSILDFNVGPALYGPEVGVGF